MRSKKELLLKKFNDNGFFVLRSLFSNKELKVFENEIEKITEN
tara:strand:+ start:397 stop:525 length:129 start_codon:yes stop_codon:yes gene_type:complete